MSQDPPVILVAHSELAQEAFRDTYEAPLLLLLPLLGLRYRIDLQRDPPTEAAGLLHQVVIWHVGQSGYGLRLWLREDGQLLDLETGPVSVTAFQARVIRWDAWEREQGRLLQHRRRQNVARRAATLAVVFAWIAGCCWLSLSLLFLTSWRGGPQWWPWCSPLLPVAVGASCAAVGCWLVYRVWRPYAGAPGQGWLATAK